MSARWQRWLAATLASVTWTWPTAHAQTGAESAARHRLQRHQLEDALRLDAQQALIRRGALSPSDARRLDELQLRQRAEQQRLAQEQLLLERQRAREPHDGGLQTRQRLLDQERALQLQRFQMEQHELLRAAKPRPLQRPAPNGALQP